MDDKPGRSGLSYMVDSWAETCEWIGSSYLTVLFLNTALWRFSLDLANGDHKRRKRDRARASSGE